MRKCFALPLSALVGGRTGQSLIIWALPHTGHKPHRPTHTGSSQGAGGCYLATLAFALRRRGSKRRKPLRGLPVDSESTK